MSNLSKCDNCQITELIPGNSGVYVGNYRGDLTDRLHVCSTCYRSKEKEFLENYAFIYTYEQEFKKGDTGYFKNDGMDCYVDRKDQNGKVLKQKDCSHCQPWKQKEDKSKKRVLAEQLKAKLNSPEYVEMPDLITFDDRYSDFNDMFVWFGKKGWISGTNINPGKENEYKSEHIISCEELEKEDFEEIANLIEKRNQEKKQLFDQRSMNVKKRLKNTPNLYYHYANSKRLSTSYFVYPDKHGEYFGLRGFENGREYYLSVNINHPVLNDFPWQKVGYYLIETDKQVERNDEFSRPWSDGGEDNPSNFHKWVEVGDQITITPYEVVDRSSEKPRKDNSNVLLQSSQGLEKINNSLLQYFRENDIKEISLKDNEELVITHNNNNNNNEIVSFEQINNNSEIRNVRNWLQITNQKSLSLQQLQDSGGSPATPQTDYTPYLIGGGILTFFCIGLWLIGKKNRKK